MSINITENELLAELRRSVYRKDDDAPADALTVAELATELGVGKTAVKTHLQALRKAGRLREYRVARRDASGRWQVVPGYAIDPAPKRKRTA